MRPALRVRVARTRGGRDMVRWTRDWDGGTVATPGFMAAVVANDGSLNTLRNDGGGDVFHRRIGSPVPGATWDPAATVVEATPAANSRVALCAKSGEVLGFYVDGTALRAISSANDGVSFGAEVTVDAAVTGYIMAAAFNGSGNPTCFYVVSGGTTLNRRTRTAGVWGGATNWTKAAEWASINGIAVRYHDGDYHLLVAGVLTGGTENALAGYVLGDTNLTPGTWFGPVFIRRVDTAAAVSYSIPHLTGRDGVLWASWLETYSGAVAVTRPFYSWPAGTGGVLGEWLEPQPFDFVGAQTAAGLPLAASSSYLIGYTPRGAWLAPRSAGKADISARVVSARADVGLDGGTCRVELTGTAAELAAVSAELAPGGLVELSPGYLSGTGGAGEWAATYGFVVRRVRRTWMDGRGVIVVEGRTVAEELGEWDIGDGWSVVAASRSAVVARLAGRGGWPGLAGTPSPSGAFSAYSPTFLVAPGESVGSALGRALAVLGDRVRWNRGEAVTVIGVSASQAADWEVGGVGEHPVMSVEAVTGRASAGWSYVIGEGRIATSHDFGAIGAGAGVRVMRSVDATTDARANDWAAGMRRRDAVTEVRGELVVSPLPGLELLDVVSVTEPVLGWSNELMRVVGVRLELERGPGKGARYLMRLTLGAR